MRFIVRGVPSRSLGILYLERHIPGLEVVWDRDREGAMASFLNAHRLAGQDPVVFMEDDAILTEDFVRKVEAEIAQRPDEVINFFSRRQKDLDVGARHEGGGGFSYNICYHVPAGMAAEVLASFETWPFRGKQKGWCDGLFGHYMRDRSIKYWQVVPSLVDHRVQKSSIDTRRARDRRSKTFVDPVQDPYG